MTTPEGVPNPYVPAEVELRDFPFIPLDCVRFRDSGLVSEAQTDTDFAQVAMAVILWSIAWHQVPAATLPGDERAIAKLVGFGRDFEGWKRLSAGAMRGFVLCSDGRFHHPVIAEKALEAWTAKLVKRLRGGAGNAKRWGYAFDPAALTDKINRAERALKIVRARIAGTAADWLDVAADPPEPQRPAGDEVPGDDAFSVFGPMFTQPPGGRVADGSPKDRTAIAQGSQEKRREEIKEREGEHARAHDPGRGLVTTGAGFQPPAVSPAEDSTTARALALATDHPASVATAQDEAWGAFLAALEDAGGLSGPRLMTAKGQLRALAAAGHDVNAILQSAVARGFRDLSDARLLPAGARGKSKTRAGLERAMTPRGSRE